MSATTTNLALPYPELGIDAPNGAAQIQALADRLETLFAYAPVGDSSNSVTLGSDKLLTGSAETVILSATFTLTRQQYVLLNGKARIDNTGAAIGGVGIYLAVDGTAHANSEAGPVNVDYHNTDRVQLSTGVVSALLAAGSHTVEFRANRDSTGQMNAIASGSLSTGPTYHPTTLTVIV